MSGDQKVNLEGLIMLFLQNGGSIALQSPMKLNDGWLTIRVEDLAMDKQSIDDAAASLGFRVTGFEGTAGEDATTDTIFVPESMIAGVIHNSRVNTPS